MSITVPTHEMSLEKRETHRGKVQEMLAIRAVRIGLASAINELTIRDLSPEDLGLTSWATPAQAADTTISWIDHLINAHHVIAIYKVLQLSAKPKVSTLTIYDGSTRVGYHELEPCYAGLPIIENLAKALMDPETRAVLDRMAGREPSIAPDIGTHMEAYFGEPYIFDSNHLLRIEVKARYRTPGDYLVLGGYVAQMRGEFLI